jgi:hypothetical protein
MGTECITSSPDVDGCVVGIAGVGAGWRRGETA